MSQHHYSTEINSFIAKIQDESLQKDNSIKMLHGNEKLWCITEKRVISQDLVKKFIYICVPSVHRNWTRFLSSE